MLFQTCSILSITRGNACCICLGAAWGQLEFTCFCKRAQFKALLGATRAALVWLLDGRLLFRRQRECTCYFGRAQFIALLEAWSWQPVWLPITRLSMGLCQMDRLFFSLHFWCTKSCANQHRSIGTETSCVLSSSRRTVRLWRANTTYLRGAIRLCFKHVGASRQSSTGITEEERTHPGSPTRTLLKGCDP